MSSAMSTRSFYGTSARIRAVECTARLARKEKELKQKAIPPTFMLRFDSVGPAEWRVFHRQADALQFQQSTSFNLHVFAYESETFFERSGQRLFLVCSYQQFYHYYSRLPLDRRHHYEVIPEDSACHLYFDLEFDKDLNPNAEGEALVNILVKCICHWLKTLYNIECNFSYILVLDSSSEKKFSQHLIYHLPNSVFVSNIQAGNFVKHICHQLRLILNAQSQHLVDVHQPMDCDVEGNIEQPVMRELCGLAIEDISSLLVNHRNGHKEFFCDLGVYTRNRNFRLYRSSKLGKSVPLVIASTNTFHPKCHASRLKSCIWSEEGMEEEFFLCSLITNVKLTDSMQLLRFECTSHGSVASSSKKISNIAVSEGCTGYKLSPFQEVDNFVTSIIRTGGIEGQIRRWKYWPEQARVYYEIARNRWCENVNKQHKSNNIVIVVDLQQGVYHQECYDPDCRSVNYKSQVRLLPENCCNEAFRQRIEAFNNVYLSKEENSCGMASDELSDLELLRAVNDLCPDFIAAETEEKLSDEQLLEAVNMLEGSAV